MSHLPGLVLRVTATYLFLLLLVRLAGKQSLAKLTAFDWLIAIVVGEFADGLVFGDAPVIQSCVGLTTITGWHVLVAFAAARYRVVEALVSSGPAPLLVDGEPQRAAMARERVGAEELRAMLRLREIDSERELAAARLEPNGELSVARIPAAKPATGRDLGH